MAFWCRVKQSQVKSLSNRFKRCYFQIHGPPGSLNHTGSCTRNWVLDKPNWLNDKTQFEFPHNVRFFAAPVQVKSKQEEKDTSGPRLNEKITAEYVRLVTDEGHGVISRSEALARARRLNLDLVEVQRHAKPPVCKLVDYHKEKYKQQIKEKDRIKSKSDMTLRKGDSKEVRIAGKIELKDLQMKADMVKRLMERGYRVKCTALNAGDQDLGGLLSRLSVLIEDISIVESGPRVEKKQAYVIVRHVKFGPSKKGSGKKLSEVLQTTSIDVQKLAVSSPSTIFSTQDPTQFEENLDAEESGLYIHNEILSEDAPSSPSNEMAAHDLEKHKSAWSVSDANTDLENVFGFGDDVIKVGESRTDEKMRTATEMSSSPTNTPFEFMSPKPIFNSTRLEPQYPTKGTKPRFDSNALPPMRETRRVEVDASITRNQKLPADEFPNKEPSHPTAPNSPASSYGKFSAEKTNDTPIKQNVVADVNRYKKGSSFNSTRNPSPVGVSANPSIPLSKSDGSGRAAVDKSGQGRWGIFSSDNSNVIPSTNTESQAKVQR